jgi:hypothetical protein
MQLKVRRRSLEIIPNDGWQVDQTEIAFIEDVLGLKHDGDWIALKRHNAAGLSAIAYLETDISQLEDQKNKLSVIYNYIQYWLTTLNGRELNSAIHVDYLINKLQKIKKVIGGKG